jgi:VWFA-related protein
LTPIRHRLDTRLAFTFAQIGACAVAVGLTLHAQEQLPRFRAGASLVTVDAYFSKDGAVVTDLKPEDIEILEDDRPQTIESFRLIRAQRQGATASQPDPKGAAAEREAAQVPEARVFVLFLDQWHVSFEGSAKATAPVSAFLDRVVGADDLIGVMTPDLPARSMSLTRRTDAIDRMVRETSGWNQRDRVGALDPREREIDLCYPDNDPRRPQFRGIAKEMIERRREQKTLKALDDLITHLGDLRDERKFVVLLSEGWVLFKQNERLGATLEPDSLPAAPGVGVVDGRVSAGANRPNGYDRTFESCERERVRLAFVDHELEVRQLSHRANRANVTFYAVDPRGLAAFDDSIGPLRPATPTQDVRRLAARQGGLRELAANTDGAVVINTNDVKGGVARMMADLNAYYLLRYYSSNTNLDGRFRRITVRVSRPGVRVRARTGYLAPTEAEARAAGVTPRPVSLPEGVEPIVRRVEMTALRRGPSTGLTYVRATEARFRRTERLRVEVVLPAGASAITGRVLTNQRQALPLIVTVSTQETAGQMVTIGDVTLAPLAIGQYVLELTYEVSGQKNTTTYNFRMIP